MPTVPSYAGVPAVPRGTNVCPKTSATQTLSANNQLSAAKYGWTRGHRRARRGGCRLRGGRRCRLGRLRPCHVSTIQGPAFQDKHYVLFFFSLLFFSFVWGKDILQVCCLKGPHDVNVDIATYCFIPSFPADRVRVKYLGETGQAQQGNAVARGGGYAT